MNNSEDERLKPELEIAAPARALVLPLTVLGIDPGLASGGLALIRGDAATTEVLAAVSLVEARGTPAAAKREVAELEKYTNGGIDREFSAAMLRVASWIERFERAVDEIFEEFDVDAVAVESFVDQRSRAREEKQRLIKNRWQTPLVIGLIADRLEKHQITMRNQRLFYQNAGIVIRQWAPELARLSDRSRLKTINDDCIFSGDKIITNDHQRKALVHALALKNRLSHVEPGPNQQPIKKASRTLNDKNNDN